MEYTLIETYEYGLEQLDKKGSDFVQLPEFLRFFQSATLDFIGERIPVIEKTGQITSDLKSLLDTKRYSVVQDPEDPYAVICSVPKFVHYLFRVNPQFKGGVTGREPRLIRHGNIEPFNNSPHKRPTPEYPLILQYMDYVKILSGNAEKAQYAFMTFLRKPAIADIQATTTRILNMPDEVIDNILQKTVTDLMLTRADDRTQVKKQQETGHRKGRL